MSTPAATARYVIAADDKTKATVASINAGFKNLERGVKSTVRGINASFGILAGMGLKRAFDSIFTETAKGSKEFALALDEVKRSARDLLSSEDGAPAATEAMRELAYTLQDPAVVAAAENITSILIRGFGGAASATAQMIAGLTVLTGTTGDEIEELNARLQDLDDRIARAKARGLTPTELQSQRDRLAAQQLELMTSSEASSGLSLDFVTSLPGGLPGFSVGELNIAGDLSRQMEEFQRLENIVPGANDPFFKQFEEFVKSFESEINSGVVETAQRAADSIGEIGDRLGTDIIGKGAELSVFAEQAARNMQDAFADFLFDPFDDGMRGMLKGFVDTLRRMAAEAAAAQIFEQLGGTSGIGGFLSGLFGSGSTGSKPGLGAFLDTFSVPTYAKGTDYVPRDQLALVHRGERIVPAHLNRSGGAPNVTINTHIDARGSTPDAIKLLPEILKRNNDALESRIVQRLRSGRYN